MSIEAWPFLVSRNAVFDYRVIVAPQYMVDNKVTSLLAKAASGDFTQPMSAIYREIHHPNPKVGDLSLLFCILQANTRHLGLEENEALKDEYGRPIRLIEGLVVRGRLPKIVVTQSDLERAHMLMRKDYLAFWNETISTSMVKSSEALDLQENSDVEVVLELYAVDPYVVPPVQRTSPLSFDKTEHELVDNGDLLAAEGFYQEALEMYDRAIQRNPISAPAYRGKGDTFYYLKDYQQADQAYQKANQFDSKYALAHNGKGLIFAAGGNYKKAINAYEQAVKHDSNCALAYANMGKNLFKLDRRDEAIEAYEKALEAYDRLAHDQNKAIWHYYKSLALKALERYEEANLALNKARDAGYRGK
jgi:hypothetical protein